MSKSPLYLKKLNKILPLLILFPMLFFMVFNTEISDYAAYRESYHLLVETGDPAGMDFGYVLLEKLGIACHASFPVFRGVYLTIACVLLFIGIRYFSGKDNVLPLMLYCGFPFLLDAVQMRWFMASGLVMVGLVFLTDEKRKLWQRAGIYAAFEVLALSQHLCASICVLYFLVLIDRKKLLKLAPIAALVLSVLIAVSKPLIETVDFSKILTGQLLRGANKLKNYAAADGFNKSSYITFLRYVFLSVSVNIMAVYMLEKKPAEQEGAEQNCPEDRTDAVMKILLVAMLFVPFTIASVNFYRLYRSVIVFIYILFFTLPPKKSPVRLLGIILCASLFLEQMVYLTNHWYEVFIPFFKYNVFW